MLAKANMPDLIRPCAIIIEKAPSHPHLFIENIPLITSAICLTEEYAIMDFISVCRKHRKAVIAPPVIAKGMMMGDKLGRLLG